jgi:hypothetical protein
MLMGMNNTLESHRFFPHVAWALVIGFALFTANLAFLVSKEISGIGGNVENLQERVERLEKQSGIN